MAPHPGRWRRKPMIGTIALAGMLAVMNGAARTADPTCRVVNKTQSKHFPPDGGQSLTDAITAAMPGDELTVIGTCTGTYTLDKDLTLTGLSTRKSPIATLDGGRAGATLTVALAVTATVTNLKLTGGTGHGNIFVPYRFGGGIYNQGTLSVVRVTVTGNTATDGDGGGIYNAGNLTVEGLSVVTGNRAEHGGGLFNVRDGTVVVRESSMLSGNTALDFGGGVENFGTLTIDNASVTGNNAQYRGGGINSYGTLILRSATVSNNTVSYDGAGIFSGGGTVTLDSSTVSGNMGGAAGGGIYNAAGVLTVNGSALSQNTSGFGGGIYNGATLTLNSSGVTGNTAYDGGGGIYNNGGLVNLNASVVSGNTPDNCVGVAGC